MESPSMLTPTVNVPRPTFSLPSVHSYYILLKAHYFLFFSAFGIIYPILNITLRSRGLSNIELSYINIIIPFLVFFTNPLLGFIADHSRRYLFTFNFVLAIVTIVYAGIFILPTIKLYNIQANINNDKQYGYILNFCASQDVAIKCASRSQCGCSYQANCTLINSLNYEHYNQMKTFFFTFSMNSKSLNKEINNEIHTDTCGIKYRIPVDHNIKQYIQNSSFDLFPSMDISSELAICEITCSIAHFCYGSRYPNQIGSILLYSLLFIIGTNLLSNAVPIGASIGFANLNRPELFGQQRVYGTIGFGVSAFVASRVYEYFQTNFVYIIMFSITTIICMIVTSFIHIQPNKHISNTISNENIIEEKQTIKKKKFHRALFELLILFKKIDIIIFLCLVFIWGMSYAALDPYLYLYIDELAPCQSHSIVGWMSLVAALSEVSAFFLAGRILKLLGTNLSSIIIFLAFSIRFGGFYFIQKPYFFILMETMHFFNFGILYVLITQKADSIAPPGLSGTLQGVALGILFGLGRGIGLLFSSFIYAFTQQPFLFLIFTLFNLIAAIIYAFYIILNRQCSKKPIVENNNISNIVIESDIQLNEESLLTSSTKN
ncbi:unnamed protein product [Rotaria sp. Silwood1]|nr:unnamed protein product [Rotaria sp. Silwood1]CAF3477336.1 unnamed protein product [Rotaria sp. Silwood1]CAF4689104.1 unnamed protein product [Rotaria sp. Silwood1]